MCLLFICFWRWFNYSSQLLFFGFYSLEKSHQELHEINSDLEERILDIVSIDGFVWFYVFVQKVVTGLMFQP